MLSRNLFVGLIIIIIAVLTGSASALFLWCLDRVTEIRELNLWIVYFLPIIGVLIAYVYHKYGKHSIKGNNLIFEEYHHAIQKIPLRITPLIFSSTVLSHLFGASVGREGTAMQMGTSIADQFSRLSPLKPEDRKGLLVAGISAGFASVFGTPFAALIFALEVLQVGRLQYRYVLHSILAAFIAHYICLTWGITHAVYTIPYVPHWSWWNIFWAFNAGIIFGLAAYVFAKSTNLVSSVSAKLVQSPVLRIFIGGTLIVLCYHFFNMNGYMGLGLHVISDAFSMQMENHVFLVKLLLTAFTIGVGYKGGEVTPLFFVGATLGNVLIWFIPLPSALLAGMGFVAVFAGATNTPIACTIMAVELFGFNSILYTSIACFTAFLFSGYSGIYLSQKK